MYKINKNQRIFTADGRVNDEYYGFLIDRNTGNRERPLTHMSILGKNNNFTPA